MKTILFSLFLLLFIFSSGCSTRTLSGPSDMDKLDPLLQKLLSEENVPDNAFSVYQQSDGTKLYGVLIYGATRTEIQSLNIHVNSMFGDLITAKVSREQLASIIKLKSVYSVKNSLKNYPQ